MISWRDLYGVLTGVVPLYVAMILGYGSVRWWKVLTPEQCSGINRFVAIFPLPFLSFHLISTINPYTMIFRFLVADILQKLIVLAALAAWARLSTRGSLDWSITVFSISTLPNTLVIGIPLLVAMYGPYSESLLFQIVVLQFIIWFTLILFLFELRAARILISHHFSDTAASIVSFRVDSDITSLNGGADLLQADAEVGGDGRIHVTLRKSTSSRRSTSLLTPEPLNLTGAEIYSLSSSRSGSNFNHSDFVAMSGGAPPVSLRSRNFNAGELYSMQSSRGPTSRSSNFDEHHQYNYQLDGSPWMGPCLAPQTDITIGYSTVTKKTPAVPQLSTQLAYDAKDLHMLVWSSSASPMSDVGKVPVFGRAEFAVTDVRSDQGAKEISTIVPADFPPNGGNRGGGSTTATGYDFTLYAGRTIQEGEDEKVGEQPYELPTLRSSSRKELNPKARRGSKEAQMPPASVMTQLILLVVLRKLIRNPNTYSSLIGLMWCLVAFRWHISMPAIIKDSISIFSDAGLGMAMFSVGLFMALQPKIIACGNAVATFAMAARFLIGPAVMAAASVAVGLRGDHLRLAIIQAALPQGIVPFVFAKEYNVHPTILSTAVIFGMLIALPILLVYYILLGSL